MSKRKIRQDVRAALALVVRQAEVCAAYRMLRELTR